MYVIPCSKLRKRCSVIIAVLISCLVFDVCMISLYVDLNLRNDISVLDTRMGTNESAILVQNGSVIVPVRRIFPPQDTPMPTSIPTSIPSASPSNLIPLEFDFGSRFLNKIVCFRKYNHPGIFYLYHMRKAGGSAIRFALRALYVILRVRLIEEEGKTIDEPRILDAGNILSVTSLRHPIDRIVSLYWYEHVDYYLSVKKNMQLCKPFHVWVNAWLDGSEWKNDIYSKYKGFNYLEIDNYYTKSLIGWQGNIEESRSLNDDDFEKACVTIQKFDIILITEWLSIGNQSEFINVLYGHASTYIRPTLSGKRLNMIDELQYLQQNLENTLSLLYERNYYDLRLFEYAKYLIVKRSQSLSIEISKRRNNAFNPVLCPRKYTYSDYNISKSVYEDRIFRMPGHKGPF